MENSIFREKNVESISSPDSLNDYIRVVRPSLWLTLATVVLLLIGVTVWSVVGRIDDTIPAAVVAENGNTYIYVDVNNLADMPEKATITVNGRDLILNTSTYTTDNLYVPDDTDVIRMFGDLNDKTVRVYKTDAYFENGIYKGTITVGSIRPITFVTN